MESWRVVYEAEANARLLRRLAKNHNALDFGKISKFFEVGLNWRCPCCHRSKEEIARLDRNAHLLCELHRHHDHFGDEANSRLPSGPGVADVLASFCRFPDVLICSDCNVAEPAAKRIVGAPSYFTFTPYEIATFITVRNNKPHLVDDDRARQAYEAAKPAMVLIRNRLSAVLKSAETDADDFETAGAAAWRVLKKANAKRKGNGDAA